MRIVSVIARSFVLVVLTMATAQPAAAGDKGEPVDPKVREKLLVIAKDLTAKDPAVKIKALEEIMSMGKEAKAISPGVCKRLLDEDKGVRLVASDTLKKINPPLYSNVRFILNSPVGTDNSTAFNNLARMKKGGHAAMPVVMHYIERHEKKGIVPKDAGDIAVALAWIAPKDEAAALRILPWLTEAKDSRARAGVANALSAMAGGDKAVEALVHALRADPSAEVRKSSATSLGILRGESKEVRAALENAKTDRDESVREAARKALAKISAK